MRVFAWKEVEEGHVWLAQTEQEYSLWSNGEWRSWEDIVRLARKSLLGEVEIEHLRAACSWARKHRPIPVSFATFLQTHMSLEDIERVVARREREGLCEEEREKTDWAKVRATRLMVDVYSQQKQFPFKVKWNNRGEPCEGDRLYAARREQTYFRGSKVEGIGGQVVRFLHLTTVDLGNDAWLEARTDAKSGIVERCLWLQATVGTPCCRHFGHIEYMVGIQEINQLDVSEWELYFIGKESGKGGVVFWKYAIVPLGYELQGGGEWIVGGWIKEVLGRVEVVHRERSGAQVGTHGQHCHLGIVGVEGVPGSRLMVAAGCEERWTPDLSQSKRDRYWETIPIQPLGDAELRAHRVSKFIRWEDGEPVFQGSDDPYAMPPVGAPRWLTVFMRFEALEKGEDGIVCETEYGSVFAKGEGHETRVLNPNITRETVACLLQIDVYHGSERGGITLVGAGDGSKGEVVEKVGDEMVSRDVVGWGLNMGLQQTTGSNCRLLAGAFREGVA